MEALPAFQEVDIIQQAKITWDKLDYDNIRITADRTKHETLLYQDDSFDFFWFFKQANFLDGLTDRELFLLKSYTRNGDEVINGLFRLKGQELVKELMRMVKHLQSPSGRSETRINIFDPVKLETINESNVVQVSTKYANEVFEIFKKAPPVENPMRVFRGLKPDLIEDNFKVFPLRGITSTTYNPMSSTLDTYTRNYDKIKATAPSLYEDITKKFVEAGKPMPSNCCVYDIILRPGVRAIWLEPISQFPGEQEIVLLPSIIQASYSHPTKKTYAPSSRYSAPTQLTTFDVVINPIIGKTFTMKGGLKHLRRSKRRKTRRSRK
jgi:hypothetical protein